MSTVLLDNPIPVPHVSDGMIVTVNYLGQFKIKYRWLDDMGRNVTPEWWDGEDWGPKPTMTVEPYVDGRGNPKCVYDSLAYRLEVGKPTHMPIECARLWFGDERSKVSMDSGLDRRGRVAWVNDRQTEVRRLRVLYDNRLGDEMVIIGHPVVEVFDLDGQRVPMVLDDPQGQLSTPASITVADTAAILAQMQKQQGELDRLKRQLELQRTGAQRPGSRPRPTAASPRTDAEDHVEDGETEPVPISELPEDPNG